MSDNECLLFSLYCCTLLSFSLPFSVVESGRIEKPKQSTAARIRYKSDDWHTYWLPDWFPDWHTIAVRDIIDRPDWLTYGLTSDCRLAVRFDCSVVRLSVRWNDCLMRSSLVINAHALHRINFRSLDSRWNTRYLSISISLCRTLSPSLPQTYTPSLSLPLPPNNTLLVIAILNNTLLLLITLTLTVLQQL